MPQTPHQRAEAELTKHCLTFPETSAGPGWQTTRGLYVRKKMFCGFGAKGEPLDELTVIMKPADLGGDGRGAAVRPRGARLVQTTQLGHRAFW